QHDHQALAIDERHRELQTLPGETIPKLHTFGIREVEGELFDPHRPPLCLEKPPESHAGRETVLPPSTPVEPSARTPHPDGCSLDAHRRRHARRQIIRDAAHIELARDGLTHLEQRLLIVELVPEKEAVERCLEAAAK